MSTIRHRKSFDNETSAQIGRRIRAARGEASQEDFAKEIGVSRSALTNYEAGRRLPNDLTLAKIAEIAGVPVQELLFGSPIVPFGLYAKRVEAAAMAASKKAPGFIPRFMLSDDEYSFIALFRMMQEEAIGREILHQVVDYWDDAIGHAKNFHAAPPIEWGEGHLARLKAALRRGEMEEGFDPHQALWATFWEELDEREKRASGAPEEGPQ